MTENKQAGCVWWYTVITSCFLLHLRPSALIRVFRKRLFLWPGLFVWLIHSWVGSVAPSEPTALHGRINDTWGLFRYLCCSDQNKSINIAASHTPHTGFVQHRRVLKIKYTEATFCFLVANKQLDSTTKQQLGYAWKNADETTLANWNYFGSAAEPLRQSLHNDGFKYLL